MSGKKQKQQRKYNKIGTRKKKIDYKMATGIQFFFTKKIQHVAVCI